MSSIRQLAQLAKYRLRGEEKFNKNVKKISSSLDEALYNKVKELLAEEEEVINPIARLMDNKHYNSLNEEQKERYFFELVDKYKLYREKIEEESLKRAN